ncbi:MAG: hypothetical protein HPY50_03900 [Firmicutes bacterium]|nr:hypothetical protein [Bacillota bacterium]
MTEELVLIYNFKLFFFEHGEELECNFYGGLIKDKIRLPFFGLTSSYIRCFPRLDNPLETLQYETFHELYIGLIMDLVGLEIFSQFHNIKKPPRLRFNSFIPKTMNIWNSLFSGILHMDKVNIWPILELICMREYITNILMPHKRTKREYFLPNDYFLSSTIQLPNEDPLSSWFKLLIKSHNSNIEIDNTPFSQKYINNFFIEGNIQRKLYEMTGGYIDFDKWLELLYRDYFEEVFRYRTGLVGSETQVISKDGKNNITRNYYSDDLQSLAWVEIMWAIEKGVYAHICDSCNGVFALTRPYKRDIYNCPDICRKKRRTQRMGGEEKLREYNRDAQKKSRARRSEIKT